MAIAITTKEEMHFDYIDCIIFAGLVPVGTSSLLITTMIVLLLTKKSKQSPETNHINRTYSTLLSDASNGAIKNFEQKSMTKNTDGSIIACPLIIGQLKLTLPKKESMYLIFARFSTITYEKLIAIKVLARILCSIDDNVLDVEISDTDTEPMVLDAPGSIINNHDDNIVALSKSMRLILTGFNKLYCDSKGDCTTKSEHSDRIFHTIRCSDKKGNMHKFEQMSFKTSDRPDLDPFLTISFQTQRAQLKYLEPGRIYKLGHGIECQVTEHGELDIALSLL